MQIKALALKIVVLLWTLVVVASCSSGSSGTSSEPTATGGGVSATASRSAPTTGAAESTSGSSPAPLPPLALSALPRLAGGYSYLDAPSIGDPVQPPKIPSQPPVRGFAVVGVAKGSTPPAVASLELMRFDAGLASSPVLDKVATEEAQTLGKGNPGKSSTAHGVRLRTVSDIQGIGVTGVVFRRGADIVLIFCPEPARAHAIASAFITGY